MTQCPCSPDKKFNKCCGPFHKGAAAPTAEKLMRSRYSAYVLKDYDYLNRTCHPDHQADAADFADQGDIIWKGLEIVDTEAGGEDDQDGIVEFVARYSLKGAEYRQHERSNFIRQDGQWIYLDGEFVKPAPVHSEKVGRNEPCPCGSGKKHKKCCL
ncbi:MAG: SEC-C domain-containing protein [Proteobacteria bacterium]|nr:SEC-C domain-containing protein [Pseudomonadota bacterium]MBU1710160.1 SEC-C domain-containing protein [Pseudomonadota bacterium]